MTAGEVLIERGRKDVLERDLLKLLRSRFGALPETVAARIHDADTARLRDWFDRALTAATLEEVISNRRRPGRRPDDRVSRCSFCGEVGHNIRTCRMSSYYHAVHDQELEDLRRLLGLEPGQKADLLREAAALASWVVRQAESGRTIEARRGRDVEPLVHPALERVRARRERSRAMDRIALTDAEVERLAGVLDRGFTPTPALRSALEHLADPGRRPPKLRWKKRAA